MRHFILFALSIFALAFVSTNVQAAEDDSFTNFESIVNELKASADEPLPVKEENWDEVAMHAGFGIATSLVSLDLPDGNTTSGLFKGIQLSGGFNLFNRDLRVEGAFNAYQRETLDRSVRGDLKEFDAKLVYAPKTLSDYAIRLGVGLGLRYLDLTSSYRNGTTNFSAQTPSSLLFVGLEKKMSKSVSIGPDVAYRSAIADTTFDKSSWDASLRLNATF